jgi:ABC-type transporter MlaC component
MPQGWGVYDPNVLGAWLVQTYRQKFNETIQQSSVDGLTSFSMSATSSWPRASVTGR